MEFLIKWPPDCNYPASERSAAPEEQHISALHGQLVYFKGHHVVRQQDPLQSPSHQGKGLLDMGYPNFTSP